jgi:hypothetical protein
MFTWGGTCHLAAAHREGCRQSGPIHRFEVGFSRNLDAILRYSLVLRDQSWEFMVSVFMENLEATVAVHPLKDNVKVLVNIRPLITTEL